MGVILQQKRLTNTQLLNIVAEYYEIHPDLIAKRDKSREVSDARFVYYRLLKDKGYTLKFIGKLVGGRTHGTVSLGLKNIDDIEYLLNAYIRLNSTKNTRATRLQNYEHERK